MLTPVYFNRSDSAFCKLPTISAKKYGYLANSNQGARSSSLVVIQLRWSTQRDPVYVCWLGEISQVSDDVIELPAAQFEQFSALDVVTIEDAYAHVEEAIEVYFKPLSSFDWEIISSHAATVEQNLLRQISIAYVNQIIRVKVTRNLSVQLSCQSIKTKKRCVSLTDTTSSSAFDRVVRMSGQTLAMIEPLTTKPIHTSSNASNLSSTTSTSSSLLASTSHHQSAPFETNNNNNNSSSSRVFHALLTQTDSRDEMTLRVLPQRLRVVNTGYQHTPPHHHSLNDDVINGHDGRKRAHLKSDSLSHLSINDNDCFNDCIDMYKGDEDDDDDIDDEDDDMAMMREHGDGDERPYEGLGYDDLTCFVHPSSCFLPTSTDPLHLHPPRSWWLAVLQPLDTSTASTSTKSPPTSSSSSSSSSTPTSDPLLPPQDASSITSSLVQTLVVRVQTSPTVRPAHISLPLR